MKDPAVVRPPKETTTTTKKGPRKINCKTLMSSEQSVNFFNLPAHVSTAGAVLVNGCYCCHTMLLPNGGCFKKMKHLPRPLMQDIGSSCKAQCCCVGFSFCFKTTSNSYECNTCQGEHACSAPCCKFGKAKMNLAEAQCCWCEAQLCCCVHRCLPAQCAPYDAKVRGGIFFFLSFLFFL